MNRTYSEETEPYCVSRNKICAGMCNSSKFIPKCVVIAKKKEKARILSNSSQVLTWTLSPDLTVNSSK